MLGMVAKTGGGEFYGCGKISRRFKQLRSVGFQPKLGDARHMRWSAARFDPNISSDLTHAMPRSLHFRLVSLTLLSIANR
jgi:hypothetical protein